MAELTRRLRLKQSNVVWPELVRNSYSLDRLLWHGSPHASLIQKIGSLVFGLVFFSVGATFGYWWTWQHSPLAFLLGLLLLLLGIRVCLKAFMPTHLKRQGRRRGGKEQ
jgi:hypothetical protein